MIFSWLKRRRRQRLLAKPFPPEWLQILERNIGWYPYLTRAERLRLQDDLRIFGAEKQWEGCGGQRISDEIIVTISAQACLLLLAREHDYFQRVQSILVYPGQFAVPRQRRMDDLVLSGEDVLLGEAWYRGPVILSWQDVLEDSPRLGAGQNLVWHEFAHQLDMLDRAIDGTPPLASRAQYRQWQQVMTAEYQRLAAAAKAGRESLLDPYGATNEAEFFAVVTECFFDMPIELNQEHPQLYALLQDFYLQDPAARLGAGKQPA